MMVVMMNSDQQNISPVKTPNTEKEDWAPLYGRIRKLALRRSAVMIDDPEDAIDDFDRGARALRTLMSAAEVARRMKTLDAKEDALHDGQERPPIISDAKIREVYNAITETVERIAGEDAQDASDHESVVEIPPRTGGEIVEDQCS